SSDLTDNNVPGLMPDKSWSQTRFQKNTVKLKKGGDAYQTIIADNIDFEDGDPASVESNRGMYVAFADITDYVNAHTEGEYFVADIATSEGPDQSGVQIGYYGGWGIVVVYENPLMNPRNIVVFDGFRFVQNGAADDENQIDIAGFLSNDEGPV